ncbi:MAG: HAMP domain-containing protein, partial [Bacteroidota bacterium]
MKVRLFWKVLGYFGLLLVVLSAVTYLTLSVLRQIEKHFVDASSNSEQLLVLEQLNKYISELPAVTNEYLYTGNDSVRAVYDEAWKEFDGLVAEIQRTSTDTSLTHRINHIRASYYNWISEIGEKKMLLREEYVAGKNIQKILDSLAFLDSKTRYLVTAREELNKLITDIISSQPATINLAKNLTTELGTYITIINLLVAFFAVALGFVLTRSLTNPIQLLKSGTQGIMEGKFIPIVMNRKDELGELAAAFNNMSTMLGNNYTRLKAYSELVTALNSHERIADIEEKSLNLLCFHSNAAVGALYLTTDDGTLLELAAGHGLKKSIRTKKIPIGEGLPGQCALEQKTIEISDIRLS